MFIVRGVAISCQKMLCSPLDNTEVSGDERSRNRNRLKINLVYSFDVMFHDPDCSMKHCMLIAGENCLCHDLRNRSKK